MPRGDRGPVADPHLSWWVRLRTMRERAPGCGAREDPRSMAHDPDQGVTAPVQIKSSAIHGRGLFAAGVIDRGSRIGEYRGPPTSRNGAYVLWITEEDGTVHGIAGKNRLRFVNHSRRPNAAFDGSELRARRRIRPGEEITVDYGPDWD